MAWPPPARCWPPSWAAWPSAPRPAAGSDSACRRRRRSAPTPASRPAIAAIALLLPCPPGALQPPLAALYDNGDGGLAFAAARLVSSLLLLSAARGRDGRHLPARLAVDGAARRSRARSRLAGSMPPTPWAPPPARVLAGFVLLPVARADRGATLVGVVPQPGGRRRRLVDLRAAGDAEASTAAPPVRQRRAPAGRARGQRWRPWPAGLASRPRRSASPASPRWPCRWSGRGSSRRCSGPPPTRSARWSRSSSSASPAAPRWARGSRGRLPATGLALAVCVIVAGGLALAAATTVDATVLLAVAEVVARPEATLRTGADSGVGAHGRRFSCRWRSPSAPRSRWRLSVAARDESSMVADLGLVYAVNTLGAILGALGAGFALVPWLGLHRHDPAGRRPAGGACDRAAAHRRVRGRPGSRWPLGLAVGLRPAWVVPSWDPRLLSSGAYKYARALRGPDLVTALTAGELPVLPRGFDGHRGRATARRHHVPVDRRQGRRLRRGRHAHPAAARARAAAAAPGAAAGRHPRPGQRRHARLGAHPRPDARGGAGDFPRGGRGVTLLRPREPSRRSQTRAPELVVGDGRTHLLLGRRALRRDRVGAVQPVDGRHRVAVHPRVLRDREGPAGAGRRAVPVGAYLRHQRRRPALDRRDVPRRCSPTAPCGWSARPTCCWSGRPSR